MASITPINTATDTPSSAATKTNANELAINTELETNTTATDLNTTATDLNTTAIGLNTTAIGLNTAKVTNANHTGDVTGATALTIGSKKVTLGMMEDGVGGELITYDASGVAAKVATGTADQVLTSNGVGAAPTFQDASGGGSVLLTREFTTGETWTPITGLTSDTIVQLTSDTTAGTFKIFIDNVLNNITENSVNLFKVTSSVVIEAIDIISNIDEASYASKSFSVSSQDTDPQSVAFNTNGTKMFIVGGGNDTVYQYTLTTGFDVSTASYASKSFSVSSQDTAPRSIAFNTDGTKMFIVGGGSDTVYQYTLSTGFDVSTASYASKSFSVSSQEAFPQSIAFNTDGTKMFIVGTISDTVFQYTLSTGFDVSTASYASKSFSVSSQDTDPQSVAFNTNGTKMFIVGGGSDTVYQYTLSTGFDVSTASYASKSFSVSSQEAFPQSIAFNTDGTKMFIVGGGNDTVFQYSIPSSGVEGLIAIAQ